MHLWTSAPSYTVSFFNSISSLAKLPYFLYCSLYHFILAQSTTGPTKYLILLVCSLPIFFNVTLNPFLYMKSICNSTNSLINVLVLIVKYISTLIILEPVTLGSLNQSLYLITSVKTLSLSTISFTLSTILLYIQYSTKS